MLLCRELLHLCRELRRVLTAKLCNLTAGNCLYVVSKWRGSRQQGPQCRELDGQLTAHNRRQLV
jgi:hypothetical protein